MKKQTLIVTLAVTALFAASAFAGSYDSDLDADIIDNQMVGQEPTGRVLTAAELAFDPYLDADIYNDPALYGSETSGRVLERSELAFEWIHDGAECTALYGTTSGDDVAIQ